jgi:endonuclease-8
MQPTGAGSLMPEGHTIHRAARLQAAALGSGPIATSSPQGRFTAGARRLDGATLVTIRAVGKHLFYHWDREPTLHVHLGLFGRFRTHRERPAPPPSPNARLTMTGNAAVYLSGPTVCELLDPDEVEAVVARLGPDPLDGGADPRRFYEALERRTAPIGTALLDQRAIAGIGNIYRAELLFLTGIHPDRPANAVTPAERTELWTRAAELLAVGERLGRIVTVDPRELGVDRHRAVAKQERLYVYQRTSEPCRRCGSAIRAWKLGTRSVWACPACQPE